MKSDLKYIIKKIIIGVGIAVGVMCVKNLPVFAEEKEQIASCQFGRGPKNQFISYKNDCTKYIQNIGTKIDPDNFNEALTYEFPFYDATFHFKYETSKTNSKYMILYDEENNSYIIIYLYTDGKNANFSTKGTGNDKQFIYTGDTSYSVSYFNYINIITPKEIEKYEKMYNNSNSEIIKTEISNDKSEKLYLYQYDNGALPSLQSYGSVEMFNPKNLKFIKTNFENVYVENEKIDVEEIGGVPKGFEKIDMKDKYAVVFYPKDVRKLEKKCTDYEDIAITDEEGNVTIEQKCTEESYYLNFYRKGKFNIKISDIENMNYADSIVTGASDTELVNETFIINKNEFKNSIIFYNNEQNPITDEEGNVTLKDYGGSGEVYYDPTLYGYFIIDNPDSEVNEDISYIDENGNEKTTHVDTLPKQDASYDFNVDFNEESIDKFDVKSGFLSFVKMINGGVGFFKKYIGDFMKGVPEFVYYFIIFVPILSIIVAVIKIVNR